MRLPATAPSRGAVSTRLRLHGWRHPTVVGVALLAVMAGYGQFSVTTTLGDVAAAFGEVVPAGATIAEQAGLSATSIGLGLAVIRLASLAALPLSSTADHLGRRRVLVASTALGLVLTVLAAATPTFWWFVVVAAIARPQFSAANAVGGVVASEETASADRSKALALGIAGYGVGVGLVTVARVPLEQLTGGGFRWLFASAAVLLVALPFVARMLGEPDRFVALQRHRPETRRLRSLAGVARVHRRRLALLALVSLGLNLVTGPVNTFVFLYAESILGVSPARMAIAVVLVGPLGLVGLLVGRWASDRVGRRATAITAQVLLAAGGVLAYTGSVNALYAGYWLSVTALGAYGPPMGALSAEVFPTSVRATAAGWLAASTVVGAVVGLVLFGLVIDATNAFGPAAAAVAVPCAVATAAFLALPETRGLELEESAPETS